MFVLSLLLTLFLGTTASPLRLEPGQAVRLQAASIRVWDLPKETPPPAVAAWAALPDSLFHPASALDFGGFRGPVLLKVALDAPASGRWWISTALRTPEFLTLRLGSSALGTFGTGRPFHERSARSFDLSIPLDLRAGADTLWILAHDPQGDCFLLADLIPDRLFAAHLQFHGLLAGIALAILALVLTGATALWIAVRERGLGWYVATLACGMAWIAVKLGLASAWLWPDHPVWNRVAPSLLSWSGVGLFLWFLASILQLGRHHPRLRVALAAGALFHGAVGLSALLSAFAPELHASLNRSIDFAPAQALFLLVGLTALVLRIVRRDALAIRLGWAFSPLLVAMLIGAVGESSLVSRSSDWDTLLVIVATLFANLLTIVVLTGEVLRRERAHQALRREFHQRLLAQADLFRQTVALELHDDVCQEAAALRMLAHGNAGPGDGIWQTFEARLGALVERVRALSHELHPPLRASSGLASALKSLCAERESDAGVDILCRHSGDLQDLSPETSLHLLRIAQEALSNALRHGHPRTLEVDLVAARGNLALTVADDGGGFPADARRPGLGLMAMEERARALGGTFEVRTDALGTRIRVVVPRS